jgi:hypothetical protein
MNSHLSPGNSNLQSAIAAFGMTNTLLSFFLMNVRGIKELTFMAPVM